MFLISVTQLENIRTILLKPTKNQIKEKWRGRFEIEKWNHVSNLLALKVAIPYIILDTIRKQNLNFVERGAKVLYFPNGSVNIYFFKVNKRNTRKRREIWVKLTNKTQERRQWHRSGVFLFTLNIFHTYF